MNERIRELAEQAGINIDSFQFSGTPIKYIVDEPSLEKFAELIVRECADIITETRWHLPPTQQQIAVGIKEHFDLK
jgi:hypothetical protein